MRIVFGGIPALWRQASLAWHLTSCLQRPCRRSLMTASDPGDSVVYLVRHGESTWNLAAKRLDVWTLLSKVDHPLTADGVKQAKRLASIVKKELATGNSDAQLFASNSTAVFASPLTRALSTAIMACGSERQMTLLPDSRELAFSAAGIQTPIAAPDSRGSVVGEDIIWRCLETLTPFEPDFSSPSIRSSVRDSIDVGLVRDRWWTRFYESRSTMRKRLARLLTDQLRQADSRACVLVSHSMLIKQLFKDFASPSFAEDRLDMLAKLRTRKLENCGVVRVVLTSEGLISDAELVFGSALV